MTTALSTLSTEERAILEADRNKGGNQFPSLPQIRLANKDMKQAPEGEYFIETKNGKDEEPTIEAIGKSPEIVILYKTNTYSYFTPEDGLIAWTSDIHGFGPMDTVTLFRRKDGEVVIDFEGSYAAFKQHKEAKYTIVDPVSEKKKQLLKFKTVLYVLYQGKPYKMFVSNASSAGVDAEGRPSFDKPQPKSLQIFTDTLWHDKRASYEFAVTLGSQLVETSKPFYIMQFVSFRELPETELATAIRASQQAQQAIYAIDDARKASTKGEKKEEKSDEKSEFGVDINYESDVDVRDLPF